MDCTVRAMTCRFGACCSSALNCPWWHSAEEIKIFKDEVELQKRKLAVRCGFCARGECRFGEGCKRAKRVEEIVGTRAKSVAPTDLGDDVCAGAGGEAADVAAAKADSGNGKVAERRTAGKGVGRGESVADTRPYVFGRRKVGVARKPSAMVDAGGVGGAGAFGALASTEEDVVEEEVDITFLLPKPKVKVKKEKKKEKAAVKAAADATGEVAEDDSGAAGAAAEAAVVRAEKLRDLEVLSIWSNHIDKTSEAADSEQTRDAAEKTMCPLVAAMLVVKTAEAAEAVEAAISAEEKAAVAAAEGAAAAAATATADRKETKTLLEMRALQQDRKKTTEKAEDRAERLRKSLANSMW
jgi:hypothetical protein